MKNNLRSWRNEALTKISGDRDENSIAINAILKKCLNKDQVWILSNLDYEINAELIDELNNFLTRVIKNEPLPYILEEAAFFGISFQVSPDVLIPRPETELLVETVINWINQKGTSERLKLLDIGTGSGCIPISIMKNTPNCSGIAVDISARALKIAKQNAELSGVKKLSFIQSDLTSAIKTKFNIITGNLPYIPTEELSYLRVAEFEPWLALDGGLNGLIYYERLFPTLANIVAKPGLCMFEIHHDQGEQILNIAKRTLSASSVNIIQDYSGFDRFIKIEV